MKKLHPYHNDRAGRAARDNLQLHLWYEALSLFDEAVSALTKHAIVSAMIPAESGESDEDDDDDDDPQKWAELKSPLIPQLEYFCSLQVNPVPETPRHQQ